MKELKLYQCEICGTRYKSKEECKKCETGHINPEEITGARYRGVNENAKGYPLTISIKMSDGQTIVYKR